MNDQNSLKTKGAQRLSLPQLKAWEALGLGMFIHFGMSTFDGDELSKGDKPSNFYAPDKLDVDQWISVARDAGMKYAILTAKHHAGHCLWPSAYTDYHVGTSGYPTDVVNGFVQACEKRGVLPGLYYASWDNHHTFGSKTPSMVNWSDAYTTREYQDFQAAQIRELLTRYGKIDEVWIDIPGVLPRGFREDLYRQMAADQPEAVIMMNHGVGDGREFRIHYAWPTDLIAIERYLPGSFVGGPSAEGERWSGHAKWREIEGQKYYMPGEVCDPVGKNWFYTEDDFPRSDEELLGMYLVCRSRGTNLLLDVGPDRHGLIPQPFVDALFRLRRNIDLVS